jgi:hypothetical protein
MEAGKLKLTREQKGKGRTIDNGVGVFWRRGYTGGQEVLYLYAYLGPILGLRLTIDLPTKEDSHA